MIMLLDCIFHVSYKFRRGRILLRYYLPKTPRYQRGISANDILNLLCDRTIPNGKKVVSQWRHIENLQLQNYHQILWYQVVMN